LTHAQAGKVENRRYLSRALLRGKTAPGKPTESRLKWFALLLPRLVCKIAMDAEGDTEFFFADQIRTTFPIAEGDGIARNSAPMSRSRTL
jgi:hypothetical protein